MQFGALDELLARAHDRLDDLHESGVEDARLYGADENDGVGGMGSVFLLLDESEVYGLPPDPVDPTRNLGAIWAAAAAAAVVLAARVAFAIAGETIADTATWYLGKRCIQQPPWKTEIPHI